MSDVVSGTLYLHVVLVLAGIVAVLIVASILIRRFGLLGGLAAGGKRRLGVVEAAAIDTKRRLVLLRRDNIEHLVLLGPNGATVVEAGIRPPAPSDAPAQ